MAAHCPSLGSRAARLRTAELVFASGDDFLPIQRLLGNNIGWICPHTECQCLNLHRAHNFLRT